MSEIVDVTLRCSRCGFHFEGQWTGKALRCPCGSALTLRDAVAVVDDAEDEGPGDAGEARASVTGHLGELRRPVIAALERGDDEAPALGFMDLYFPGIVLASGMLFSWVLWFKWTGSFAHGLIAILIATAIQVILLAPFLFVSLMKTSQWFGLGLGTLFGLIYRVLALTLGAGAVCDIAFAYMMVNMEFDVWSIPCGFAIYTVGTGALLALFFDMDMLAACVNVLFTFMPRMAILFTAGMLLPDLFP